MQRRLTTPTKVGNIIIGGDAPIRVQSMNTTNTNDTEACVAQAKRIIEAGGELVRLTTQGSREAENMKNISAALKAEGYMTPLVADVHFNANVADVAALYCEKVRVILRVSLRNWNIPTRNMLRRFRKFVTASCLSLISARSTTQPFVSA